MSEQGGQPEGAWWATPDRGGGDERSSSPPTRGHAGSPHPAESFREPAPGEPWAPSDPWAPGSPSGDPWAPGAGGLGWPSFSWETPSSAASSGRGWPQADAPGYGSYAGAPTYGNSLGSPGQPPAGYPGQPAYAATTRQGYAHAPGDAHQPGYAPPYIGPATGSPGNHPWSPEGALAYAGPAGWPPAAGDDRAPARGSLARALPLLVALGLLLVLVSGVAGGLLGGWIGARNDGGTSTALPAAPTRSQQRPPGSVPDIAARLLQRVVSIQTSAGSGSGFIVRPDGYIVTNNHVIAAARGGGAVRVLFQDGHTESARIVGADESYDLAVLKVPGHGLPTATFGDSAGVVVGDPVIAVGSPLGLSGTVTTGIVSALDRPVTAGGNGQGACGSSDTSYYSAIQTDAAINPGNSGGPLVNDRGEVIGVNSAISTLGGSALSGGQTGSIGLGFAIPSNQAKRIAEEIIKTGSAVHPVLGVSLDCAYSGDGARVGGASGGTSAVTPGGPADAAGLRDGDVITALDGKRVSDAQELIVAIRTHVPGDEVTVTYVRNGSTRTARVKLGTQKGG